MLPSPFVLLSVQFVSVVDLTVKVAWPTHIYLAFLLLSADLCSHLHFQAGVLRNQSYI